MKKTLQFLIVCIFLVLPVISLSGEVSRGVVYTNKFVGLELPLPEEYYIGTNSEFAEGLEIGNKLFALDSPGARAADTAPGQLLLVISQYNVSSIPDEFNNNIIITVIDARTSMKGETVDSLLEELAGGYRRVSTLKNLRVAKVSTQNLGGTDYRKLTVDYTLFNSHIHQSQIVKIHNDYIILIVLSANSPESLNKLTKICDILQLSPVSKEVNNSLEGRLFRANSQL